MWARLGRGHEGALLTVLGPLSFREELVKKDEKLALVAEHRTGVWTEVVTALWEKQVRVEELTIRVGKRRVTLQLVVDKPGRARRILATQGWHVRKI